MFRFRVFHFGDAGLGELINARVGIRQQYRRMRGDHQLRLMINQPVQQRQNTQLPLRRQRRLRLIKQINAVALEPVQQKR